jgi:hypothetical protein
MQPVTSARFPNHATMPVAKADKRVGQCHVGYYF